MGFGYGQKYQTISSANSVTLPANMFTNSGNKYFLFEGAGIGEGQLTMTISQNGNTIAQTSAYLDIHDIKDLYEQAHANNIDTAPPSTKTSALVEDKMLPANSAEDQQVIVFVHGLNVGSWEFYSEAETMFKRLYWQGYNGRFAAFDWPSPLFAMIPTGTNEISYLGFNTGEYVSWHSGAALKAYIDDLHNRLPGYTMNLAVHRLYAVMGNSHARRPTWLAGRSGFEILLSSRASRRWFPPHRTNGTGWPLLCIRNIRAKFSLFGKLSRFATPRLSKLFILSG